MAGVPKINYKEIIEQMRASQLEANAANDQRDVLLQQTIADLGTQIQGTYGQAEGQINQIGQAAAGRIERRGIQTQARGEQSLISSGLYSSTMAANLGRAVGSDVETQLGESDERMAGLRSGLYQNRAGAEMQLGGMKAGAIEGRFDEAIDPALYAQMLQAAGQTGALGGSSGGGGPSYGPNPSARVPGVSSGVPGGGGPPSGGAGGAGVPVSGGGARVLYGPQASPTRLSTTASQTPEGAPSNIPMQAAITPQNAGKTITVVARSRHANAAIGTKRRIQIPASDLGSGPGGFKDTESYLRYIPKGFREEGT